MLSTTNIQIGWVLGIHLLMAVPKPRVPHLHLRMHCPAVTVMLLVVTTIISSKQAIVSPGTITRRFK